MDAPESGPAAAPLASPRRRLLVGLGLALLVVRIALPFVLRPLLVARADEALVGRVELADLDLSLLRGGVTLHGLSVHTDERPGAAPPLFEAKRLWTQISWLALLSQTIEIEELELEGFDVRLDRFEEGLLLPKPVAKAEARPEAEDDDEGTSWSLAADAIVLRDGRVELRDHTVEGPPETFALDIEDFTARELAIRSDPADDEPGRVAIEAKLDQGSVSLAAWIEQSAAGLDVKTNLVLHDLPLDRLRAYLPMFDWNALSGRLDADLEHRFVSGRTNELRGELAIADLKIGVPRLDEPALAWEKLAVGVDRLDLVHHAAELGAVTSTGARLVVEPRAEHPLPLLAPSKRAGTGASTNKAASGPGDGDATRTAAATEATEETEETAATKTAESADDAAPWTWRIANVLLEEAQVEVRGGEAPVELGVEAALRALSSEAGSRSPLAMTVTASPGTLALAGELALASTAAPAPVAFAGRLTIRDLALAPLLAPLEAPAAHWLRKGSLRSDLRLALARDLRVAGTLGLEDLELEESSTAKQFGLAWKDLEVVVASLALPDVLGTAAASPALEEDSANGNGPTKAKAAVRSLDVSLARVALVEPRFRLTRDAKGLVLPPLAAASAATSGAATTPESASSDVAAPAGAGAAAGAGAESAAAATPPPEATAPLAVKLAIADLRIQGGRGKLADRAVEPYYRGRIEALDVEAKGVRWPEGEVEALELALSGLHGAKLNVKGALTKAQSTVEAELVELPLEQFNPYLTSSGYSLRQGALSLRSKGRFEAERFKTRSRVVVSSLDLGGSEAESLFQESFGIPLNVALGLLTDLDGKITLAVPVAGQRDKVKLGFGRIVGQALRKALVGALASPLKLLGAVARDGKVEKLAPEPIAFAVGESTLSREGSERVEELAGLLAASPGLRLVLTGRTSAADELRLRERALLAELESSRGVRALAALGELSTRRAVRDHLARRLAGGSPPPLNSEQTRWLEARLEARAPAPDALAALARRRAEAVRALLASDHGIAAARLALADPSASGSERLASESGASTADLAGVAIGLGAIEKPAAKSPTVEAIDPGDGGSSGDAGSGDATSVDRTSTDGTTTDRAATTSRTR